MPYSGRSAALRSCLLASAVAWWPVEYSHGLGDLRVLGVCAVACRLLGHRESQGVGVTRMSVESSAEGGEDVAHEGCMCCPCFFLCVDGG